MARTTCQSYCQKLRDRFEKLGLPLADSDRLKTATATLRILEKLHLSADGAVVGALASAEVATSESAMGECLNKAGTLAATLDGTNWEIFEAIAGLTDERKTAANAIRSAVEQALRCDEHVKPLAGTLKEAQSKAVRLLTVPPPPPPPASPSTSAPTPRPKVDRRGNAGVPAHRRCKSEARATDETDWQPSTPTDDDHLADRRRNKRVMATTAPTFSQIRAQVAAIRRKLPEARVIGIRAPGRWTGERIKRHGEETYVIEQCDSPLALRIALREEGGPSTTKVLITNLDEKQLSDDILVRLAKRQLFPIDSWQIVKSLFQAHAIDPRLTRHRFIADYLMEFIPDGGYPAVSGGFLDAETVWPILLGRVIGLVNDRPDLAAILKWSIEASCRRAISRRVGRVPRSRGQLAFRNGR